MQQKNVKRIQLVFPDTARLWAFAQTLHTNNIEINSRLGTLVCDCTEIEIEQALYHFGAKIQNSENVQQPARADK